MNTVRGISPELVNPIWEVLSKMVWSLCRVSAFILTRTHDYRKVNNKSRFPISFAFFSQFVLSVLCSAGSIDDPGSIFAFRP